MGLAYAALNYEKFESAKKFLDLSARMPDWVIHGPLVGLVTFVGISFLLWRAARSGQGAVVHPHA